MSAPRRILIAGCGDVGGALAGRLLAGGAEVWGIRRRVDRLPPGVRPLAGDLVSGPLPALPADLDAVVFAAAPDRGDEASYRQLYVGGLHRLLAAVAATGAAPRTVFSSSTAVYAQRDGEEVDEASETSPTSFRGRLLLAAEELLAAASPGPGVAVRFGGIYGPGRAHLVERARTGPPAQSEPPLWTNRIHREDAAATLAHLLELASPPPVVVAVDREPAPLADVLFWLRRRLGLPPFVAPAAEPQGRRAESSKRCSSRRLVASGFVHLYPTYREGYGALLDGTTAAD